MMKGDVTRDVAGAQDAEKITIRLEVDGKCICVESQETIKSRRSSIYSPFTKRVGGRGRPIRNSKHTGRR